MDWIENYVNAYFMAEGQRVGLTAISGSRRVVLYEIPSTISLATVLEAVAAPDDPEAGIPGGIISAQIFKDLSRKGRAKKYQCALIEFVHPLAAQRFVSHLQDNEVHFNATNTWRYPRLHRARARLASTQSTSLRPDTIYQLLAKQTRALVVPTCPPEIVWEILATIGTQVFTKVKYLWQDSALVLEFVSMFEANRAYGLLCSDFYPHFAICKLDPPQFKPDSTQRGFESISNQYVQSSGLSLDTEFKKEPFNLSCAHKPPAWEPFYCLSLVHQLCLRNDILPHELPEWLTQREALAGQDVELVGSGFNMTRTSFGRTIDPDSRMKLLLANSLHNPQFAKAWDDYFHLRKLPNLRRYEAYGTPSRDKLSPADANGESSAAKTSHRLSHFDKQEAKKLKRGQSSVDPPAVTDRRHGKLRSGRNPRGAVNKPVHKVPSAGITESHERKQNLPWLLHDYDEYLLAEQARHKEAEEARRREAKNAELGPILIPDIETTDHEPRDGPEVQNVLCGNLLGSSIPECAQAQTDGDAEDLISFEQDDDQTEDLISFEQDDGETEDLISF